MTRALLVVLALVLAPALARAQVETDGSLGPAGLVPGGALPDGSFATYRIDESLGRRRGGNLFHSFSRFTIPGGSSAAFTADLPTERVLARVTGVSPSVISGRLISTIPGADLYLMNPNGVVFGAGSSLDLQGSLYVSTAAALRFSDGTSFSALPPSDEVLSVAQPSAWGFSGAAPAAASFRLDRSLSVPVGETISVAAGAIALRGTSLGFTGLSAPGGEISLTARTAAGDVPLDAAGLRPTDAASGEFGSIALGPNAILDVSDPFGASPRRGRVVIRGGTLTTSLATIVSDSAVDADEERRDVDVETSDSIDTSRTELSSIARGAAQAGGVRLASARIGISDASLVRSRADGGARAGDVEIEASAISVRGASRVESAATEAGTGRQVRIRGGSLEVLDGAQISGTTEGSGAAGDVDIEMSDSVLLSGSAPTGPSGIFARSGLGVGSNATGAAGEIRVSAPRIAIEDGAEVSAQSFGEGAGGAIRIDARDGLSLSSTTTATASINSLAALARGGDIAITAGDVVVANGGLVSATTTGSGDAGDISITAPRLVVGGGEPGPVGGAGIFAQSLQQEFQGEDSGRGGDIELRVSDRVEVLEGGVISAGTLSNGDAGTVRFDGTDRVLIRGGSVKGSTEGFGRGGVVSMDIGQLEMDGGSISTAAFGSGAGGQIAIDAARDVTLDHGATLGATTERIAEAGDVQLAVGGRLTLLGGSRISTQTNLAGQGGAAGDIAIRAKNGVFLAERAEITSATAGSGNAGTIDIDGGKRVQLESGARITSQTSLVDQPGALAGNGGSVGVRARGGVTLSGGSAISAASSGDGDAGSVRIHAGRISVGSGSSITSQTDLGGVGGDIDLHATQEIVVAGGGQISASSAGPSDAGTIRIDAGDQLTLRDGGRITTQADTAFGGNIELRARKLLYVHDGEITTSVNEGAGNGGNIDIDPKFVVLDNGRIVARANAGNGGNIIIRADHFLADVDSVVDASSELGIDGQVLITAPETDLTGELVELSSDYLDASSQLARACASRSGGQGTFNVVGATRPRSPDEPLQGAEGEPAPAGCPEPAP